MTAPARDTAPGYVFVALKNGAVQHGPVIIDDLGRLVWFNKNRSVRDFRVQRYGDRPVLTWWEGVQEWCQGPPNTNTGAYFTSAYPAYLCGN